ncbi:ABC transporter permease [Paenibacillus oryzae]|uniref:ABC transporter permease n=1 Tax=Paenibacillus oryzae TaxID=1844972 RepID=UPI001470F776|nr:ABC transporter permease [Paenibacillus oryzae]
MQLFKDLLKNDIKNRYTGSILGLAWSIIHPLSSLLIYYFVFSVILKMKIGNEYADVSFTFWLMAGILPWFLFSEALSRSTNIVLDNSSIIKKMVFPAQILPFVMFSSALINHLITVILFIIGLYTFNPSAVNMNLLLFPVYLVPLFLLTTGLSMITASLNVFLRDIGQFIGILINVWFYMTPIIYPISAVPEEFREVLVWNPMYSIIEGYRMLFFKAELVDINSLLYTSLISVILFALGYALFSKLKKSFADVL